jgi:quinol monooxygenase YgiN
MSLSLIVVALGAVVAAVGTGLVTARCARDPRIYLMAWAVGLFGLAISLGAQTVGYLTGYSPVMFRAMELGAQVIAPLAFCLALAELVGKSLPARFAMRLAASALAVIAVVILGTDPLSTTVTFSKHWPNPAVFYELVPKAVLEFALGPFTALVAIVAAAITLWRYRREQPARNAVLPITAASIAALAVALPALALLAQRGGITPPAMHRIFGPVCLLAAGLTWLAAAQAGRHGLGEVRAGARRSRRPADDEDEVDGYGDPDRWPDTGDGLDSVYQTGGYDSYRPGSDHPDDRYDVAGAGPAYGRGRHGEDAAFGGNGHEAAPAGPQFGGDAYPALAALVAEAADAPGGPEGYRGEAGRPGPEDRYGDAGRPGGGDQHPAGSGPGQPRSYISQDLADGRGYQSAAEEDPRAHLFGQIAIYTLIEERVEEFDRLTELVVAQVRAREPGTLVYIVHAVPTAPMQRILYEVYRDRAAYDEHMQRPYVIRYEAERRPFVLASNVIELGLRQAKVSPLPSISDILTESGIDLTGVTRSPRGMAPPPGAMQPGMAPPGVPPSSVPPPGMPPPGGDRSASGPHAPPTERHAAPVPPGQPPAGPPGDPGYDPLYQGWSEIRGEDPRSR